MTAVPEGTTWITFNEVTEIKTSNGGMFYMLRIRPYIPVCRLDQRFGPLIKDELERLQQNESVEMACIPDPTREGDWRISLKYYEARHAEKAGVNDDLFTLPIKQAAPVLQEPEETLREIKVDLPLEQTKVLQDMFSVYKIRGYEDCSTLREFRNKIIAQLLEPYTWSF